MGFLPTFVGDEPARVEAHAVVPSGVSGQRDAASVDVGRAAGAWRGVDAGHQGQADRVGVDATAVGNGGSGGAQVLLAPKIAELTAGADHERGREFCGDQKTFSYVQGAAGQDSDCGTEEFSVVREVSR